MLEAGDGVGYARIRADLTSPVSGTSGPLIAYAKGP
jgi:hypothetical protein